jgi:hypothetical protein
MQKANIIKAGWLAVILTFVTIMCWEIHLRHVGNKIDYDDNTALWANKRGMVYQPKDQATVFIGSSRIKYDLNIPTWRAMTGENAVQLANQGSNPRPVLSDLANDPNFKGKLIVDVTEEIFFGAFAPNDEETFKRIEYYHHITPTQRASLQIDRVLESQFVFLNQDEFSIKAMLDEWKLPRRPGIFPGLDFPADFGKCTFERESYMTPRFVADTNLQNRVKAIWTFIGGLDTAAPVSGTRLDAILNSVKADVDKIKSRGGEVIFVRTPSSGNMLQFELHAYPRAGYWDKLLAVTGCRGVFYTDYPDIAHLICPEWSHLKPADGLIYTRNLVKILQGEKGWTMSRKEGVL